MENLKRYKKYNIYYFYIIKRFNIISYVFYKKIILNIINNKVKFKIF